MHPSHAIEGVSAIMRKEVRLRSRGDPERIWTAVLRFRERRIVDDHLFYGRGGCLCQKPAKLIVGGPRLDWMSVGLSERGLEDRIRNRELSFVVSHAPCSKVISFRFVLPFV